MSLVRMSDLRVVPLIGPKPFLHNDPLMLPFHDIFMRTFRKATFTTRNGSLRSAFQKKKKSHFPAKITHHPKTNLHNRQTITVLRQTNFSVGSPPPPNPGNLESTTDSRTRDVDDFGATKRNGGDDDDLLTCCTKPRYQP